MVKELILDAPVQLIAPAETTQELIVTVTPLCGLIVFTSSVPVSATVVALRVVVVPE